MAGHCCQKCTPGITSKMGELWQIAQKNTCLPSNVKILHKISFRNIYKIIYRTHFPTPMPSSLAKPPSSPFYKDKVKLRHTASLTLNEPVHGKGGMTRLPTEWLVGHLPASGTLIHTDHCGLPGSCLQPLQLSASPLKKVRKNNRL